MCSNLDLKLKISMTLVVLVLISLTVFGICAIRVLAEVEPGVLSEQAEIGFLYVGWEITSALLKLMLALSAFAVVSGMLLGWYLTRRLHKLVDLVKRVKEGELTARADARGDDEIAYLADNLNDLVRQLETKNLRSKDA